MEWTCPTTLNLISQYKEKTMLWDPKDENYYNKLSKNEAWEDISGQFNTTTDEVKKKMQSLLASMRREKAKIINSKKSNLKDRHGRHYRSTWYAFKSMSFLLNTRKQKLSADPNVSRPNDISTDDITIKLEPVESIVPTFAVLEDPKDDNFHSNTVSQNKRKTVDDIILDDTHKSPGKKIRTGNEDTVKTIRGFAPRYTINMINDECDSFGKYVADKLRSYPNRSRCALQHAISNIIFSADQGLLENAQICNDENDLGLKSTTLPFESVNLDTVTFLDPTQMRQTAPTSPVPSGGSHESANCSDVYDSESLDFTDLV